MYAALNHEQSAEPQLITWECIDWVPIDRYVKRLQQRIYRAEKDGNHRKVRDLQRLLTRSDAALLSSIKRVTQLNKGKRTPGVDHVVVRTSEERAKIYNRMRSMSIKLHKPSPARRTYIKKKNGKLRPLGIPTIIDRVYQNMAKLALEPQWEMRFESSSYGFRPKRSTHDAIEILFKRLSPKNCSRPWIFEGDFKGCFDNLNHDYILEQLKNFPLKSCIFNWLNAGYVDDDTFHPTEAGTPQGGIISPLLANIALHGMEEALGIKYQKVNSKRDGVTYQLISDVSMVRYADDFVILCRTEAEAKSMFDKLLPYLVQRGLELAPDKTKVTHLDEGFDFLGFNLRRYPNGKVLVKPSKESIRKAKRKISEVRRNLNGTNVFNLISNLNPVIRGYANYWRHSVAKEIFTQLDYHLIRNYMRFLKRLHPTKPRKWLRRRYFRPDPSGQSKDKWLLTCPGTGRQLIRMSWTPIKRHIVILHNSSPFDKTLNEYFRERGIREFDMKHVASRQKMAKAQFYVCPLCGTSLSDGNDTLDVHHKLPKALGGKDVYSNLQLVHSSCHIEHHQVFPVKGKRPNKLELFADRMDRKSRKWIKMNSV